MEQYGRTIKRFMNGFKHPEAVVGNYQWHQNFPYEKHLLSDRNDDLVPVYLGRALDFGCGPGRMINRMKGFFREVDGVDISSYCVEHAKKNCPGSQIYESSGYDIGHAPEECYDMVYSTIAIQHIPIHEIRTTLFKHFYNALFHNGYLSIQMAYRAEYPGGNHARYNDNLYQVVETNGACDVVITNTDIDTIHKDLEYIGFSDIDIKLVNVEQHYHNLNGHSHGNYWASHWIFIKGRKV